MSRDEFDPQRAREDREAFETWRDLHRNGDDEPARDSNPLADLLAFLSDGYHTGTLLARSLAFLLVLRPDLVAVERDAGSVAAVAGKAGLTAPQLSAAVLSLRETAPDLDQVMREVRRSRARFLALAEIKARRRALSLRDAEAMAEVRRNLAPERVRKRRATARDWEERKRLRVARQVLALADPLTKAAAADMRAFDRSLGLLKDSTHEAPRAS
jgi:hypothetical protein